MNNLQKIKDKLAALDRYAAGGSDKKFGDTLWKPQEGKQTIRIVPNFNLSSDPNELPVVPLYFYHDFGKKYQLAPSQFDRPDPIFDAYKKMYKDEDPEVRELAKKLNSKIRLFVPIIVRGKEADGVKFWGFPINIYNEIKSLYDDPQWGNISDLENGVDLTIEFIPSPVKDDNRQAKTNIVPNRKSSVATTDADLLEKIKNMIDVTTLFTEPSYDELKVAVESYLGIKREPEQPATAQDFDPNKFKPAVGTPAVPVVRSKDVEDVEAAFEAIINSKK